MNVEYFEDLKKEGLDSTMAYLKSKDMGYNAMESTFILRNAYGLSLIEAKSIMVAADNNNMTLSEYQENLIPAIKEALKGIDKKDIVK